MFSIETPSVTLGWGWRVIFQVGTMRTVVATSQQVFETLVQARTAGEAAVTHYILNSLQAGIRL